MSDGRLAKIGTDFKSTLVTMKWILFLQELVPTSQLPKLFDYYARIGWISQEAARRLIEIANGLLPIDEEGLEEPVPPFVPRFKDSRDEEPPTLSLSDSELLSDAKESGPGDWRLSAEDHLRSYMFIEELIGEKVDKETWNAIELRIGQFRQDLKQYYGV